MPVLLFQMVHNGVPTRSSTAQAIGRDEGVVRHRRDVQLVLEANRSGTSILQPVAVSSAKDSSTAVRGSARVMYLGTERRTTSLQWDDCHCHPS